MKTLTIKDYPNHEVKIVKIGEVTLEMLRSKKVPDGDFLPANAADSQGKRLWSFKDENFDGFGKLVEFKGEYFIYLEDRQRVIHRIILVSDLPKIQRIAIGDQFITIGGRDAHELYLLKVEIAKFLHATFVATKDEQDLLSVMAALHKVELEKERIRKQEELQAKEQAKLQRIAEILARVKITAHTDDGKKRFGSPVVGSEWEMLPNDTAVVVVNDLEEKIPTEAFFVKRNAGGRVSKGSPVKVSAQAVVVPKDIAAPRIEGSGIIRVLIDGRLTSVVNFSKKNFDLLRKTGLNSGTMVSVGEPNTAGKYTVVQLKGSECLTVGEFAAI